jgi:hypothetical protein
MQYENEIRELMEYNLIEYFLSSLRKGWTVREAIDYVWDMHTNQLGSK